MIREKPDGCYYAKTTSLKISKLSALSFTWYSTLKNTSMHVDRLIGLNDQLREIDRVFPGTFVIRIQVSLSKIT